MNNQPTAYQSIISKAWSDPEYKERFLRDPKAVLTEAGVQIPVNVEIVVCIDTDEIVHLVLPTSLRSRRFLRTNLNKWPVVRSRISL